MYTVLVAYTTSTSSGVYNYQRYMGYGGYGYSYCDLGDDSYSCTNMMMTMLMQQSPAQQGHHRGAILSEIQDFLQEPPQRLFFLQPQPSSW